MPRVEARHLEPGMLARRVPTGWSEPTPFVLVEKADWFSCYGVPMTRIWFAGGDCSLKVPADDLFDVLDDGIDEVAS